MKLLTTSMQAMTAIGFAAVLLTASGAAAAQPCQPLPGYPADWCYAPLPPSPPQSVSGPVGGSGMPGITQAAPVATSCTVPGVGYCRLDPSYGVSPGASCHCGDYFGTGQ